MSTAVSAPGKVFLAGGYLVLDRAYTALVFGLSARIHVHVQDIETSPGVALSEIVVQSPQFREAVWTYGYRVTEEQGGVEVTQLQGSNATSRNPFVETALLYALTYISTILPSKPIKPTKFTIFADNDYYSQPSSKTNPRSTEKFANFNVRLSEAHKTGLGSSAALVTAFTGALLTHYLPPDQFSLSTPSGRSQLHNLAQISHCAAQGKIGSGFDVAAAVYGTCIYRRFSPSILSHLGEPGSSGFSARVRSLVDDESKSSTEKNSKYADQSTAAAAAAGGASPVKWDYEISKSGVGIPKGMALVMCDVDCGSQTVSMVKKVLEWRKADPAGSSKLMDELQLCNEALAAALLKPVSGNDDLEEAGKDGESRKGDIFPPAFNAIRTLIRKMGTLSNVPIEPPEQTALLDAVTSSVPGVHGGVVPGAGGYDAVVLLVDDDEGTREALEKFLERWSLEKGGNVRLLQGARGELEGARREDAGRYGAGGVVG